MRIKNRILEIRNFFDIKVADFQVKRVQGNTSNIVFLKSTDDAMLDTLQKMSGTTHKAFKEQKSIQKDMGRLMFQNDDKVTITVGVKEIPVISYNDMAFIKMCNSIIFRAGDSPIWNRNQTCLPMSWRLFANTIIQPGKEYSLQTIPTLSSALDFDVRQNQPNFIKMWEKRRDQAMVAGRAKEAYKKAYGYDDDQISRLDPDNYSDDIIQIINEELVAIEQRKADAKRAAEAARLGISVDDLPKDYDAGESGGGQVQYDENKDFEAQVQAQQALQAAWSKKTYAGGRLSKQDFVSYGSKKLNRAYDDLIVTAYVACQSAFANDFDKFQFDSSGNLYGANRTPYLTRTLSDADVETLNHAIHDSDSRLYAEEDLPKNIKGYTVQQGFYQFLLSQPDWLGFAGGKFETEMAALMQAVTATDN